MGKKELIKECGDVGSGRDGPSRRGERAEGGTWCKE